jgi:predicted TIM-barrel fold metal-dependent hydrolase
MSIIDCHVHVKGGDYLYRQFSAECILETMDEAGIERSCIFSICLPSRESNELTAQVVSKAPERLIPWAHGMPNEGISGIEELRRAIEEMGFKGVKMHYGEYSNLSLEDMLPIFKEIESLKVPVIFDCCRRDDLVESIAKACEELKLIVAHMGDVGNERTVDKFISIAKAYPNVYLDTAWSWVPWKIADAVEECGAEKIIFGSDGPLIHPAIELKKIEVLKFSLEEKELILSGNILRLMERNSK